MAENSISAPEPSQEKNALVPERGERVLVVGQTGSGKTTFVMWLLTMLENSPVVIYDTKVEPKFEALKNSTVVHSVEEIENAIEDQSIDYIIFRPDYRLATDPFALDSILEYHYLNWHGVDAYIDELYQFHDSGRAGPGITALYTRGRSKGITTIAATQRPAWISRFAMSETQKFMQFFLGLEDDLKRMAKDARMGDIGDPPEYHFWFRQQGQRTPPVLVKPIPIVFGDDPGYTDSASTEEDATATAGPLSKTVWI